MSNRNMNLIIEGLTKEEAMNEEDRWITIKGTHVQVDDKGTIKNENIRKKIEATSKKSSENEPEKEPEQPPKREAEKVTRDELQSISSTDRSKVARGIYSLHLDGDVDLDDDADLADAIGDLYSEKGVDPAYGKKTVYNSDTSEFKEDFMDSPVKAIEKLLSGRYLRDN